jgi:Rps23 Pro-64 3,4-dihydroxylase Tpa1-like proline 4-hydroxylase
MINKFSRKKYKHTKNLIRKKLVDMDKNMIYEKNVFSKRDFNKILSRCESISDNELYLDPKASGRLMYEFNNNDPIHKLLYNKTFINKIRSITGNPKLTPCLEVPMEFRKYSKGSYMNWHRDVQMLSDQLQYECVITLTNTSDSKTLFKQSNHTKNVSSKPNSVIIVRANGIPHMVTKTNNGERTILKLVFKEIKC